VGKIVTVADASNIACTGLGSCVVKPTCFGTTCAILCDAGGPPQACPNGDCCDAGACTVTGPASTCP
jgi:hypothetical protein